MIDILAQNADLCLRSNGGKKPTVLITTRFTKFRGHNAGHTIVAAGITYDFHLIPSGVLNPRCKSLIGSGCIVHVPSFLKELQALKDKRLDYENKLFISDRGKSFLNFLFFVLDPNAE
jgi:adenylosuccinate synthase